MTTSTTPPEVLLRDDNSLTSLPMPEFAPPQSIEALYETAALLETIGAGLEMRACVLEILNRFATVEFRTLDLLSRALKVTLEPPRASLRIIRADERAELYRMDLLARCERSITDICTDALRILETLKTKLPPLSDVPAVHILYHILVGDYHRYLCEVGESEDSARAIAEEQYNSALDIAVTRLTPEHPLRLGVALNRSILAYEVLKAPDEGVAIAKQAFDCSTGLASTPTADRISAKLVLDKLRENVSMWTENEDVPEDDHIQKKM